MFFTRIGVSLVRTPTRVLHIHRDLMEITINRLHRVNLKDHNFPKTDLSKELLLDEASDLHL